MPVITLYGLTTHSNDQKRKYCQSAQAIDKDSSKLISVPKQPVLMSPSSRRNMDMDFDNE
jgi:hypothetical protein